MLGFRNMQENEKIVHIFFKKAAFKVSGTSYLEDTKKTMGDSFDHQAAIVNMGNPHYVYGGTWKTCTGLNNSEIDGRQKQKHKDKNEVTSVENRKE